VLLSLFYFLSLSRISEKSENSHHAKIVNYNAFSEFLQMVPKHNFIGPFKLFLFIGIFRQANKIWSPSSFLGETVFKKVKYLKIKEGSVRLTHFNGTYLKLLELE
jgi:hypothetical protein